MLLGTRIFGRWILDHRAGRTTDPKQGGFADERMRVPEAERIASPPLVIRIMYIMLNKWSKLLEDWKRHLQGFMVRLPKPLLRWFVFQVDHMTA